MTTDGEPAQPKPDYEPFAHEAAEWCDSGGMETIESKEAQLLMEVEK